MKGARQGKFSAILLLTFFSLGAGLFACNSPTHGETNSKEYNQESSSWNVFIPLVAQTSSECPRPSSSTLSDGVASWSSPIAVSPLDNSIWVVNPDAGSVSKIDSGNLVKIAEVPIGKEPWSLNFSPDGNSVYVLDRATGLLHVIDAQALLVCATLSIGPEPQGLALTPNGSKAYITVRSISELVVLDTGSFQIIERISLERDPYAIAITDDGDAADNDENVHITHFLARQRPGGAEATDDGREGVVSIVDTGLNAVTSEIVLAPDVNGFPNLLSGIAISGNRAWVPHLRDMPALPNTLTKIAFAAVTTLDRNTNSEDVAAHLPLNDQEIFGSPVNNPVAAVPSLDGDRLYIVLAGSDLVEVVDISDPQNPALIKFLPTGSNPRGIALSSDGHFGYVMNYLSRSISVLDLQQLTWVMDIPVTDETLDPDVLRGKILFNYAVDPRLSTGSWISCASCHPDGGTDNVTWIFPDGPRQTPPLWNSGQTQPLHWSAALDELQDVESTVQIIQHGLGLAPGADPLLLAQPNAGRSPDLDALAAFVAQGIRPPAPVPANSDIESGRSLFQSAGCVDCHGGPTWTSSAMPGVPGSVDPDGNGMVDEVLRDVGTYNPLDIRGEMGFDPPSLLNVGLTGPYLHDGSMLTLEMLLSSGHPNPQGGGNGLSEAEIIDLVAFLQSIGPDTVPVTSP